ncbi:hypothetical protein DRF58_17230 [Epilithonimonas hispanica]|uniref:Uncharacterized protein n=2 Tax=Epilithonimonas hispanica TaxID=358687 RepID=A0A3D9CJV9_9FLAO|nr:hypothetical protein DRF58_17230 [Epilithonimonas hispanica]
MAKEEYIDSMIAEAVSKYGTVDILINNAGIIDDFSLMSFSRMSSLS